MPAILHLLCQSTDEQTRRLHEMLTCQLGSGFSSTTRTLGRGADFRNLPIAVLKLRDEGADLTHAWGIAPLAAAILAGHRRLFFSPDRFLGPRSLSWVRSMMSRRPGIEMICPTAAQQRLAVTRGIPFDRCHVIRPGVDFGRLRRRDPLLRQQLGLADDDFVLLAPGESTNPSGHDQAVWAAGILNVLDPRYKLLLWGRGPRTEFLMELGRRLRQTQMLKFAEPMLSRTVEFEELLPQADACLIAAGGSIPTLPILTTMAAGIPIVSTVTYLLAEQLEDRHTALMVPRRSPRALAQRVLDLREDDNLRWRIADTARAEAYEFFSMTRMLEEYRAMYERASSVHA
jgi:glycosyltransferase involved in cell wall biosynthesis